MSCGNPYDHDLPNMDSSDDYDPRGRGPWISFHDWYMLQDAEMQARIKRVMPSLKKLPEDPA